MAKVSLARIVTDCDRLLNTSEVEDFKGAFNGLQVENDGTVTRIAVAVDASLATVRRAVSAKADLLVVHHGLFWGATAPWTGKRRELLQWLLGNNLAVYSSHLPLDMHPRLGNNAGLCAALGLKGSKPFFPHQGMPIGLRSATRLHRDVLARRLKKTTGTDPVLIPGGPEMCRQIGVVTGGAGNELNIAAQEGVDTFITGEGAHWTFALAEELGMNVLYGGHYATETFGVKALGEYLSKKHGLPWVFIDYPTGL